MKKDFLSAYLDLAVEASGNDFCDNHDTSRFGPYDHRGRGAGSFLNRLHKGLIEVLHLADRYRIRETKNKALSYISPYSTELGWLYERLVDEESRNLLVQLQLYRALGERQVKLPLNNQTYWSMLKTVEDMMRNAEAIDLGFMGWSLYRTRLDSLGYPLELYMRAPGVVHQLLLQQYRCETEEVAVGVSEGDIVIDGGACYGETALYFAFKAGNAGYVYTFEFMPENLSIFHRNMALNPEMAQRIKLVEKPLWDRSGEKVRIEGGGPGARVRDDGADLNATQIETVTIDDLVRNNGLDKLDFLKMDIEGAELRALKGAEDSIRRFRPQMAISVYHRPEDFWTIPQYIASLGLGYRFALRHFTIHQEETILFAF